MCKNSRSGDKGAGRQQDGGSAKKGGQRAVEQVYGTPPVAKKTTPVARETGKEHAPQPKSQVKEKAAPQPRPESARTPKAHDGANAPVARAKEKADNRKADGKRSDGKTGDSKGTDSTGKSAVGKQEEPGLSFSKIRHVLEDQGKKLLGLDKPAEPKAAEKKSAAVEKKSVAHHDRPDTKTTERADVLTAEQRAKKGIREYTDPKSERHFNYDDHGRISEVRSKSGCTTKIGYPEGSTADKPASVSVMRDKSNDLVAHVEAGKSNDVRIHIDQKTGDVVSAYREKVRAGNDTQQEDLDVHVRRQISPDGNQSVVTSRLDGRRLQKLMIGADSVPYSKVEYHYTEPQPGQSHKDVPVVALQVDARNRPIHKYVFKDAHNMEQNKPVAREDIQYGEKEGRLSERHEQYDLSEGKAVLVGRVDKTTDLSAGKTSIHHQQFLKGKTVVDQKLTFDKDGKPTDFEYRDELKNCRLSFSFDSTGLPADVRGDTRGLGSKKDLLSFAFASAEEFKQKYEVGKLKESDLSLKVGPTPPRQGERGAGTLVWKEGAGYAQGSVKDGTIYDANKNAIGTFKDNGDVTIQGNPPKTFNVLKGSAGEAFHGVGSDGRRLELCAGQGIGAERKEGFNGVLSNPMTEREDDKLVVVGGNMYDSEGKFVGQMDRYGKLTFDNKREPRQDAGTDLNSVMKGGWVFSGNENGKTRQFDVNSMSQGRIFLPEIDPHTRKPCLDHSGQPKPPVEYEIRLGMLINKQTGEQIGKFIPPSDLGDRLQGGCIITGNPPQQIPLTNFSRAVFDVQLQGQYSGRSIKGLSLGPETKADGSLKPGSGGLMNLQHALKVTRDRLDDAKVKSTGTEQDDTAIVLASRQQQRQNMAVEEILSSGKVSDDALLRLHKQTSDAESAFLGDGLVRMKARLDHRQNNLEDLPAKTNGTAMLPDSTASGGVSPYDVRDGFLYRKGSTVPVGSVDASDGSMRLFDARGNLVANRMNQIAGGVWHLEYADKSGKQQAVDWITSDRGTIHSVADMRRQASEETAYAEAMHKSSNSEQSRQAFERARQLEERFNNRLDKALKDGIANPLSDGKGLPAGSVMELLDGGARKFVRAEHYREKSAAPKVISLRNLNEDDCRKTSGALRIGEDHYEVEGGRIYRMKLQNGRLVRSGKECGTLESGYTVNIDGHEMKLSQESQVLFKYRVEGEHKEHRVIGLGQSRTEPDGRFVSGGLVDADELLRQGMAAKSQAERGNMDYFRDKPLLTGELSNSYWGDKEGQMRQINDTLAVQMGALNTEINQMFDEGMSGKPISNNHLDHNVRAVHGFVRDMNLSTQDELTIAREATQNQKQTADAAAMTALTLLTAGSGSLVSMAGLTGRAAFGAQLTLNMVGGGVTSAAFRQTAGGGIDQAMNNAGSGVVEAAAMTFGARGTQFMQELKVLKAARLGPGAVSQLSAQEQKLLASEATQALLKEEVVERTVDLMARNKLAAEVIEGMWRPANALMQSTAFTVAGTMRDGNQSERLNAQNLALGTLWMLGGEYAGSLFKKVGNIGKVDEALLASGKQKAPWWQVAPRSPVGKFMDEYAQQLPEELVNNFVNSGLDGIHQGFENERDRLAQEFHISREMVTDQFLKQHINLNNVLSYALQSAAEGTVSSPMTSLASHSLRTFEHGMKRGSAADEQLLQSHKDEENRLQGLDEEKAPHHRGTGEKPLQDRGTGEKPARDDGSDQTPPAEQKAGGRKRHEGEAEEDKSPGQRKKEDESPQARPQARKDEEKSLSEDTTDEKSPQERKAEAKLPKLEELTKEQLIQNLKSDEKLLEELRAEARSDSLTKAGNRLGFDTTLDEWIADCQRNEGKLSVVYIDLNNFKSVNDKINYEAGDEALRLFTKTAKELLRQEDYFARFGGDEFGIILRDSENVKAVLEKLQGIRIVCSTTDGSVRLLSPDEYPDGKIPVEAGLIPVTPGLGGVEWQKGQSVREVTKAAESAMAKNKVEFKSGNKSYEFIHRQENLELRERERKPEEIAREHRMNLDRRLSDTSTEFAARKFTAEEMVGYSKDLKAAIKEYKLLVRTHPHTGLHNKAYTTRVLEAEIARATRNDKPFTMVLTDLDNFKLVNDKFGHAAGDDVLKQYGKFLQSMKRRGDFVGSFGGDEGVVVARNASDVERIEKECHNFFLAVSEVGIRRMGHVDDFNSETEVRVGISAGSAKWETGKTLAQLNNEAADSLHISKTDRQAMGIRLVRAGNEQPSGSAPDGIIAALESTILEAGKHKVPDLSRLPEDAQRALLEKKLRMRETVTLPDGTEVVLKEHPFLNEEFIENFVLRADDTMKGWQEVSPYTDRVVLDAVIEQRRTAVEQLLNEAAAEQGLPPIDVIVDDASLKKHKARATYSSGQGAITIRSEDLLKPHQSTIGVLFHELLHAEQDVTMLRASALDVLLHLKSEGGETPERLVAALSDATSTNARRLITRTYLEKTGLPLPDAGWLQSALKEPATAEWLKKRLEQDGDPRNELEYLRADRLRNSYLNKRSFRHSAEDIDDRIAFIGEIAGDYRFRGDPVEFLRDLYISAKTREAVYGYDVLSKKFDKKDSTFTDLLKSDAEFAKMVLNGDRARWLARLAEHTEGLKQRGEPYQELPRTSQMLTRLELKGLLHNIKQDQWKPLPVTGNIMDDPYGSVLHDNLKTALDDAKDLRKKIAYASYVGYNYELESHYVTSVVNWMVAGGFLTKPRAGASPGDTTSGVIRAPKSSTKESRIPPDDGGHRVFSLDEMDHWELLKKLAQERQLAEDGVTEEELFNFIQGGTVAEHLEVELSDGTDADSHADSHADSGDHRKTDLEEDDDDAGRKGQRGQERGKSGENDGNSTSMLSEDDLARMPADEETPVVPPGLPPNPTPYDLHRYMEAMRLRQQQRGGDPPLKGFSLSKDQDFDSPSIYGQQANRSNDLPSHIARAPEELQPILQKMARDPQRAPIVERLATDFDMSKLPHDIKTMLKLQDEMPVSNREFAVEFARVMDTYKVVTPREKLSTADAVEPAPPHRERPPVPREELIKDAKELILAADRKKWGPHKEEEVKRVCKYLVQVLSTHMVGVRPLDFFAGTSQFAIKLDNGTVLKVKMNDVWNDTWTDKGDRPFDCPIIPIGGAKMRRMGPDDNKWLVYLQPHCDEANSEHVREFKRTLKKLGYNFSDGGAMEADLQQIGLYKGKPVLVDYEAVTR